MILPGGQCDGAEAGNVLDGAVEAALPSEHHAERGAGTELLKGQVRGDVPHGPARAQ